MHRFCTWAWPLLALLPLRGAPTPAPDPPPASSQGWGIELHAAAPFGVLAQDVNHQFGFGFGVSYQAPLGPYAALRGAFAWTGYRVSDRNLAERCLSSLFDTSYEEDAMTLRSYALGGDLMLYSRAGHRGAYVFGGGGFQRSRLYLEHRTVDQDNHEQREDLAVWPSADTPFTRFGLGYRWPSGAIVEGRVVLWRYRAEPGLPLDQGSPDGPNRFREATSFVTALGFAF